MSVNCRLHTVSDFDILEIATQPLKLEILYYGEIDPSLLEDLNESEKNELLNWKPHLISSQVFFLEGTSQSVSYLLTNEIERGKTSFPLNFLEVNRLPIGEIGWGPANFYTSGDALLISEALTKLDLNEIAKRYNSEYFTKHKIYPSNYVWKDTDGAELILKITNLIEHIKQIAKQSLGFYVVSV